MIWILLVVFIAVELLQYFQLRRLTEAFSGEKEPKPVATPPKARESFVVKRMEQRLKEAMYPDE